MDRISNSHALRVTRDACSVTRGSRSLRSAVDLVTSFDGGVACRAGVAISLFVIASCSRASKWIGILATSSSQGKNASGCRPIPHHMTVGFSLSLSK